MSSPSASGRDRVKRSSRGVWTESLTAQLIELRRDGVANSEIHEILGVGRGQLEAEIARLIREGLVETRAGLLASHADAYVEGRERTKDDVKADVARLYTQGDSHEQIGRALKLTRAQVHNVLTGLFAEGLAKRPRRHLTEQQIRAIHVRYLQGESIDKQAKEIGYSGAGIRERIKQLGLPSAVKRAQPSASRGAGSSVGASAGSARG
jgi:hypothetical protein